MVSNGSFGHGTFSPTTMWKLCRKHDRVIEERINMQPMQQPMQQPLQQQQSVQQPVLLASKCSQAVWSAVSTIAGWSQVASTRRQYS